MTMPNLPQGLANTPDSDKLCSSRDGVPGPLPGKILHAKGIRGTTRGATTIKEWIAIIGVICMQRLFTIKSREFTLWDVTGTVKGARTSTTTSIQGTINGDQGSLSSHTSIRREIWFERDDTGIDELLVTNKDIPVLEGQKITAIGITTGNTVRWAYLYNHSSQSWWQLMRGDDFLSEYFVNAGCCLAIALSVLLLCAAFYLNMRHFYTPLIGSSNAWMYCVPLAAPIIVMVLNTVKRNRQCKIYVGNLRQFLADLGFDNSRIY